MCITISTYARLFPLFFHSFHDLVLSSFLQEFTQEVCQDSVVQTILTAQQEEMANFEGFTYDPRGARLR